MNNNKLMKKVRLIITLALIAVFVWFVIIGPKLSFKSDEKMMEAAAARYYEINPDKLPTGTRVKTLTLQDLYRGGFLDKDIYLPYSKEPCSLTESWVKTKQENGSYKHYVYLQCGTIKSKVDHTGPVIILNGDDEITINKDDKYEELGVKKVTDNKDGKIDINKVTIDSSKVNTKKNGTYEVTYTVSDSFNNKTVKIRKVNVIQTISNIVNKNTTDGTYKGEIDNNYIMLSGIKYRIIGLDNNKNVKLVSNKDIANVNYSGINKWLDYFYSNMTSEAKKYIVKSNYCNDNVEISKADTYKSCQGTIKNKNVYILSVKDINDSLDENGSSYLYPATISWLSNTSDDKNAITTRNWFNGTSSKFYAFDKKYNFGVRPVVIVKGDSLVKGGNGSLNNPYTFKETKSGKADELLNTRHSGEYISYSNRTFRIVEIDDDKTVKVISTDRVLDNITNNDTSIYNPKQKNNIGSIINQQINSKINTGYFVNKEIEVPIYKDIAAYKKEVKTSKYKVKVAAPNMYEMFSAMDTGLGYWLINSSQNTARKNVVSDIGVIYYTDIEQNVSSGARIVGYLDAKCKIVAGSGTESDPYKITK